LVKRAAEWTAILNSRIMNDDVARSVLEEGVRSMNDKEKLDIQRSLLRAVEKQALSQVAIIA